ncbi:MAG: PDZ domain-containing protein, partial [Candidatus Pacebacteria bacterium]|nr:PDZ domain-containing protein [Candidatus Paceibacterota bacterium]
MAISDKLKGSGIKIALGFLLFVALLGTFAGGIYAGRQTCSPLPPGDADMALFWETWHTLEDKYADKSKIDHQKMVYGAIAGMVSSLGDPYTSFFDPVDTKKFVEDTAGAFEGVGMEIAVKKGQLQVVSPLENSPAKKAGIKAGDAIIKINATTTSGMTTDEAVD